MNWTEQPATWKQLRQLKRCGYEPNHRLTKREASQLITRLGGVDPDPVTEETAPQPEASPVAPLSETPHAFRVAVEQGGRSALALDQRQQFWMDTCRGTTNLKSARSLVLELYRKYGCVFSEPTHKQVQDILDALDAAMPSWDREHSELFYDALGLNYPELRKQPHLNSPA
jgi:hypothetical protein